MRDTIWHKKIPTIAGLLCIIVGITITTFLVRNGAIFTSRASSSNSPNSMRITNVSDSSFTVSYTTVESFPGVMSIGITSSLGQTILDDRDQKSGIVTSYKTHHITAKNLKPSTKYFFSVTSGSETFLDNEQPFEVTTGPNISASPPNQDPLIGKVITANGNTPEEALVYVTTSSSQMLSTIFSSGSNSFIIPLNSLRVKDVTSYFPLSKNDSIQMLIVSGELKSNVKLLTQQAHPVPIVTLSKDYDFTTSVEPIVASSAAEIGFPIFSVRPVSYNPKILTPQQNETFVDTKPLFQGTASPGAEVKVIIHSEEKIETQINADRNGKWNYRPPSSLSPGEHTISIQSRDQFGILKTITQSFIVHASGSQVAQSATPSATLIPSPSVKPTLTPTTTPVMTITPTPISFTLTPSPHPTIAPLPNAGNSPLVTFGIIASVITTSGILLFLATHEKIPFA